MPIKLLSFDLDDTLWPVAPTMMRAERAMYEWMRTSVPDIAKHYDPASLIQQRFEFRDAHPESAHCMTSLRKASLMHLSEIHDHPHDWVEHAFSVFFEARQDVDFYDDVAETLDQLAGRYRMVAITNGNADISKTGADRWLELCISPEQTGVAKPHPGMFKALIDMAESSRDEIVHIGDDPEDDILGAAQAGIASVWLNRSGRDWQQEEYSPDIEIWDLDALPAALEKLESDR